MTGELISVIVSTYNWPQALDLVLRSLAEQTDRGFEVVVADDGSGPETRELVSRHAARFPVKLVHSWQRDEGFRLARSRNLAVTRSRGGYLVFIDGDCVVRSDFVAAHRRLAHERCVVAGQRILLSEPFTKHCFETGDIAWKESLPALLRLRLTGGVNRFAPALSVPFGPVRIMRPVRWQLLRGCNWSLPRADYFAVGGQDEAFEGWGYEDSDMAVRLVNSGRAVKWGGFTSPCFHLWHKGADKERAKANYAELKRVIAQKRVRPKKGCLEVYPEDEAPEGL
jgi:glycosyltransferase involved in cell wall biosynthesis